MQANPPEEGRIVVPGQPPAPGEGPPAKPEAVEHPAKAMRIASMVRQLLDEVRTAPLDEASRTRMREIYQTSVKELSEILSPELSEELSRLSFPFDERTPSDAELRVAHAQLVGWLEGLFHGIQAALFAQQMAGRARLDEAQRRGLPGPEPPGPGQGPGTYL